MANPEHLKILDQGVEAWNEWRKENSNTNVELSGLNLLIAKLSGANFAGANLSGSTLHVAHLEGADLKGAILTYAMLREADLTDADLSNAEIMGADLLGADFRGACLAGAGLIEADLHFADLTGANLRAARLMMANLRGTRLGGVDLTLAICESTIFGDVDLSDVKGLDSVMHTGPSTIGIDTLYKSGGKIPVEFLRGCGLSDWEIENAKLYDPSLSNEEINNILYRIHELRGRRAFQISPLFISHSHADARFVGAIESLLVAQGVRCWRDVHNAVAGRLERQIDRAIDLNDVVLLVLSEQSTNSDWVEHEVRKAREKEKKSGKDALCPIALDDSFWTTCRWPERLRKQIEEYNILDFSNWQDAADFQKMFGKLLEGLNLFYK